MPSDSISVQVTPDLAKFIRTKVKNGDYPSSGALIRDAIEKMRSAETQEGTVQSTLTDSKKRHIRANVQQGINDMKGGCHDEFDADGLRAFAKGLVAASAAKMERAKSRTKA